jgi:DNA recombination protein RmuC
LGRTAAAPRRRDVGHELELLRLHRTTGRRSFRPDLIVRLPGGQQIIIDAKAPNDAYREAVNASDEHVRTAKLAEHATKVRGHIDALGAKNYWEQFQPSPEFVVLFLPGDQFLSGALQGDPSLIDRAIAKKVLLATPATLIALFKATAYGWRQEDVSRNAQVIADLGRASSTTASPTSPTISTRSAAASRPPTRPITPRSVPSSRPSCPAPANSQELGAKGVKELADPTTVETTPRDVIKRA